MEKSSWMVYSVIRNVYTFIRKDKDIDLFKKVHYISFQRASNYFIENAKRIYNDIENGYYTFHDLIVFLLFNHMIGEKISLYKVNQKNVNETMKLFTIKKFKEDLKIIKEIHQQLNFKRGLKEYFDFKEDGTNIAYVLTKKGKISPIFFIRNFDKALTNYNENGIIKMSREYEQFQKIAKKIKETLKGGSLDGQAEI